MSTQATPSITVRKLEVPAGELPRRWFYGSRVHTSLLDALCLLFPEGERFFIRSVRHFIDRIDDPALLAQVKAFAAQEAWHGRAHMQVAELLQAQGYDAKAILERFDAIAFTQVEPRFSHELRLATTAAAEHFTAALAELAIGTPLLDGAAQPMRDLLRWHAIEELEHRAVAFDVLQVVDPRWRTRAAGMAVATGVLLGFWLMGFGMLRQQERKLPAAAAPPVTTDFQRKPLRALLHVGRAIVDYLRPGFHPSQRPLPPGVTAWSAGVLNSVQNQSGAA